VARLREGSAVILFDRAGRVLLQQRDDDIPPAGYGRWAIPGGGREGDESPRETALREFREETGVRLERLRFFHTYEPGSVAWPTPRRVHLFFADDEVDEAAIEVNEGLAFRYWSPEEAAGLPMNPSGRELLTGFLASDKYEGTLALKQPDLVAVVVIALDRWGRILLQLRDADLPPEHYPDAWSLPGGLKKPAESPDAGALREFEEETGRLLEELRLYRVFRRDSDLAGTRIAAHHVYYCDPDLDAELLDVNEGQALSYFAPGELPAIPMIPAIRSIIEQFVQSAHYRGLFH
jgi:8-oxo-dGTP pyrophosphatase MutT (NUDIX family)